MVRELWLLDDGGEMSAGLPKPYVELVVSLTGRHWWRATPDGQEHLYTESWVTPLQDRPRYARAEGGRRLMGARLEPWLATALFGPLSPGDGRPPPKLHDLLGEDAASLRSALVEAPDEATAFERFGTWLERRVAESAADIAFCVDTLSGSLDPSAIRARDRRVAQEMAIAASSGSGAPGSRTRAGRTIVRAPGAGSRILGSGPSMPRAHASDRLHPQPSASPRPERPAASGAPGLTELFKTEVEPAGS